MRRNRTYRDVAAKVALVALGAWAVVQGAAVDPLRSIHDSFETAGTTVWKQEQTDATINLGVHDRSPRAAHEGRLSEHFQFAAGPEGSSFYYSYTLPRVAVTNDLRVSLYVRANRTGVRIYARVILPADTDPETGQPSFVLVPGTIYDNVDRWQRIELMSMLPSIEGQARVIRATTRRPVRLEGAYLERIVINLYCGAGETEVFLDELNVAPVAPEVVAAPAGAGARGTAAGPDQPKVAPAPELPSPDPDPAPAARPATNRIALERNRLFRNGRPWFVTAIDAPGADVAELRKAGFDVLVDDINADPERFREAVSRGFLLQPNLIIDGAPLEPSKALAAAASFPFRDAVAFWGLGEQLGQSDDAQVRAEDVQRVRSIRSAFRGLPGDFSHLTTGVVADEFNLYAKQPRNLDMIGVRPNCWGTAMKPFDTYTYLVQRRALTVRWNPGGLFIAWLPATPPREVQLSVWGDGAPPSWGYPVIQPEQLRVYTYMALAAGYRGIGFRGDADLTRNDLGRMNLIEMALLNEEIDLIESILCQGQDPIPLYPTYPTDPPIMPPPGSLNVNQKVKMVKEYDPNPFTKVASIDTGDRKGSLLLITDYFDYGQCQLPQTAMNDLKVSVPARESAQGWLISPGGIKLLSRERTPYGTRFNVPDYGPTALLLVSTDLELPQRIAAQLERVRPLAVQLAIEQARIQFKWVSDINGRLLADGHTLYDPNDPKAYKYPPGFPLPHDEADLLARSEELIKSAQEALEREEYELAWAEARRAARPLRILAYNHWSKAYFEKMFKAAVTYPEDRPERRLNIENRPKTPKFEKKPPRPMLLPVASPPCLSFNLLPQHYIWVDWMRKSFSRNLVPSGTFDTCPTIETLEAAGWADVSRPFDGLRSTIETVKSTEDAKKRLLRLGVQPTERDRIDMLPPYLDYPIAAVRSPEIPVKAGQFIRISVDVSKPTFHPPGHGGVFIRDSIGGEPLQFKFNDVIIELTPVVLFRRAPADGVLTVTFGLGAYGEAFFNNFKVEVAEGPDPAARDRDDVAGSARPPVPDPATPPAPGRASALRPATVPRTSR